MREKLRIPIFEQEFLFNIGNELTINENKPDLNWIDQNWKPEIESNLIGGLYDSIAEKEVFRLLKFQTCAYCNAKMQEITPLAGGRVFVCRNCFYWGGRGTRPGGPNNTRANLGRIRFVDNPDETKIELLVNHLNENFDRLYNLTPKQAEKILPHILRDYLDCEVKAIGGVKDGGVDALAFKSENEKIIIQVKWREKKKGSEAVSVVREVAGTLLARGIPKGIIISTRNQFSKSAKKEAKIISSRKIVDIGKIELTLKDFNNLIDMFEVSAKVRSEKLSNEEIIPDYNQGWDLFGNP